jgi:Natural resistance-associated macrophage protein
MGLLKLALTSLFAVLVLSAGATRSAEPVKIRVAWQTPISNWASILLEKKDLAKHTLAGQMIMQGFVGFRIPIWVRRLVTMIPAFIVVGLGANATNALVIATGKAPCSSRFQNSAATVRMAPGIDAATLQKVLRAVLAAS